MCVYTRKQPLMGAFAHDKWACWPMAAHGLGVILMREHVGCRHTRASEPRRAAPCERGAADNRLRQECRESLDRMPSDEDSHTLPKRRHRPLDE
jgi:hypothetical protein